MSDQKKTYEVSLGGTPLKLRSSHGEDTVRELVAVVNDKVNEALKGNQNLPYQKALLLASLHIAEDLVFLRKAAQSELNQLEAKAQDILSDLESSPISRIRLDT